MGSECPPAKKWVFSEKNCDLAWLKVCILSGFSTKVQGSQFTVAWRDRADVHVELKKAIVSLLFIRGKLTILATVPAHLELRKETAECNGAPVRTVTGIQPRLNSLATH